MAAQPPKSATYYLWLAGAMLVIGVLRLGFGANTLDLAIGALATLIGVVSLWRYWRLSRTAR